jgi:integrase
MTKPRHPAMTTAPAIVTDRLPNVADLSQTAERAAGYARHARADNTRRAYGGAWSDFTAWCSAHSLVSLPAEPVVVGCYLADRAQSHKVASLRLRLVAIAEAHRLQGHNLDTRHPAIRDTWAGIRRAHGTAPTQKAAATSEIVRDLVRAAGQGAGLRGMRDKALVLIGFAAALRRSELVALDIDDIQFRAEGVVLRLRRSKTDQEGAGAEVAIPHGAAELTCPVRALQAWLEAAGITAGPVFVSITKAGRATPSRLSDRDVARVVKRLAELAGHDPAAFAGHSLRAGFATTAARAGVPEAEIMRQTRHRSVAVMRGYVRRGGLFLDNAAARVGL